MKSALTVYQYVAPAVLAPASFFLWQRAYEGDLRLVAAAWLIPVLWAYIVPGIGTNVLKVWEFNTRLRLGRFRPHRGFVFGSATAMLGWLVHVPPESLFDVARSAFVMCSVLALWNLLYDVIAIRAGILRVYNQPWADGRGEAAIAMDYAPWFFGGFGLIHGAGLKLAEGLLLPDRAIPCRAVVVGLRPGGRPRSRCRRSATSLQSYRAARPPRLPSNPAAAGE